MSGPRFSFILLFILFVFACSDKVDVEPRVSDGGTPHTNIELERGNSVTTELYGIVRDNNQTPLANTTVTVNGRSTVTNDLGYFFFEDASLFSKRTVISFEKEGYVKNVKILQANENETEFLFVQLMEQTLLGTIPNSAGGVLESEHFSIEFPPNAIKDHEGEVFVYADYIEPNDETFLANSPGNFEALNSEGDLGLLVSYGMTNIELKDESGNDLQLADDKEAELSFQLPETSYDTPQTIPLWYFDEEEGVWLEEGKAELQENRYVGTVGHFSFWNLDTWQQTVCEVEFEIVSEELVETPFNIEIKIITDQGEEFLTSGYVNSSYSFDMCVPTYFQNLTIRLNPLTNTELICEDLVYEFNEVSTESANELVLEMNENTLLAAEGTVTTCENENLTLGLAVIEFDGGTYSSLIQNGHFSFSSIVCTETEDTEGTIKLYDANTTAEPVFVEVDFAAPVQLSEQLCGETSEEDIIWEGDLDYQNEEDIQDFLEGSYNVINGNLRIVADSIHQISDINKLIYLERVDSSVLISQTDLTNLNSLNSLKEIGKGLTIEDNLNLTDISGIDNIQIGIFDPSTFTFTNNNEQITDFNNSIIKGKTDTIRLRRGIEDISGLSNLSLEGDQAYLDIESVGDISDLSPIQINGSPTIYLTGLEFVDPRGFLQNIENIRGLTLGFLPLLNGDLELVNITEGEVIQISNNPNLNSISFPNLTECSYFLVIDGNFAVKEVSAPNLEKINTSLNLMWADSLSTINMGGLKRIENEFRIEQLPLDNLNDFSSIESLNRIKIKDNENLNNFCGLSTEAIESIDEVIIEENLYNPTLEDLLEGNCTP